MGQAVNEEHASASAFDLSGHTTDATRYIELTAEPGGAFNDDPANRLYYVPAQGAAMKMTGGFTQVVNMPDHGVIRDLQTYGSAANNYGMAFGKSCLMERCVFLSESGSITLEGDSILRNVLMVHKHATSVFISFGNHVTYATNERKVYGCSFVRSSHRAPAWRYISSNQYYAGDSYGVAVLGVANILSNEVHQPCDGIDCVTDASSTVDEFNGTVSGVDYIASWGTADLVQPDATGTEPDFKAVAAGQLDGAGWYDASLLAEDIFKQARSPSTPTAGCHELVAAGESHSGDGSVSLVAGGTAAAAKATAQAASLALAIGETATGGKAAAGDASHSAVVGLSDGSAKTAAGNAAESLVASVGATGAKAAAGSAALSLVVGETAAGSSEESHAGDAAESLAVGATAGGTKAASGDAQESLVVGLAFDGAKAAAGTAAESLAIGLSAGAAKQAGQAAVLSLAIGATAIGAVSGQPTVRAVQTGAIIRRLRQSGTRRVRLALTGRLAA